MEPGLVGVVLLLLWGTLTGIDLVGAPQLLLSRPLVAGAVAGVLAGDVEAGLRMGLVLELFALDVLAIGAVRYPDYGPATVAGVAAAAGAPWEVALGVAGAVGLVVAALGGWSLQLVRHANARAIQRRVAALAAGEPAAVRALHWGGVGRDALRSFVLTALGLLLAEAVRRYVHPSLGLAGALTLALVGAGLAAAANGALRNAGRGPRVAWLAAGVAAGALVGVLR